MTEGDTHGIGMRKADVFFGIVGAMTLLLCALFAYSLKRQAADAPVLLEKARMVKDLGLTDLCIFSDARYTRHLSQADLHSAFQDSPLSLEHFPSGSFVPPPAYVGHSGQEIGLRKARSHE